MWKEAVIAYLEVISWHLPVGNKEKHNKLNHDRWPWACDLYPGSLRYEDGLGITQLQIVLLIVCIISKSAEWED